MALKILIRQMRLQKNVTLQTLSEKTGISVSHLSEVECGKKDITLRRLCKVAEAMGVSAKELFSEEG